MRLDSVFLRFYKSFNVAYSREADERVKKKEWEIIKDDDTQMWYPYIEVSIDPKITAIVGANEAGKSHLLTAIEKVITGCDFEGNEISAKDFCRYSDRFLVTSGKSRIPHLGTAWSGVSNKESQQIKSVSEIAQGKEFNRFFLFRESAQSLMIYLPEGENDYSAHQVDPKKVDEFLQILPGTRRLKNNIALPSSLPIQKLIKWMNKSRKDSSIYETLEVYQRKKVRDLIDNLFYEHKDAFLDQSLKHQGVPEQNSGLKEILSDIIGILNDSKKPFSGKEQEEIKLTHDLLCGIAQVNPDALIELADTMQDNDVGHTQALIDKINRQLSANLNFPKYWVQDNEFRLVMSAKEHNIEFTILDKTGTNYTFEERSHGLKYFLSYFIQHRAYQAPNNVPEILLMDEPDTFLSSQAQQDLLKIFDEVANTEKEQNTSQVIYVTHSPFLIDKNHAERIRVLKKGSNYEGTQVVKSVAQNHYEPLRSSLGAFVAETVYISHCNLIVEGHSDQVLLAGAATYLRSLGVSKLECLNLNEITIVPAGGATSIPYLVYLARGRDAEQPAVIVLLDSDSSGNQAKTELTKKGYGLQKKPPLKEQLVLQVGELAEMGVHFSEKLTSPQIEDLIPVAISIKAAKKYALEVCGVKERDLADIQESNIQKKLEEGETMFKAVNACVEDCSKDKPHLEKIGFARNVIETVISVKKDSSAPEELQEAVQKFESNFKILFNKLYKMKSLAELETNKEKASQKVAKLEERFFNNHPTGANREDVVEFLDKLEELLSSDDSFDSNEIKKGIENIRNDYKLNVELERRVDNYDQFKKEIQYLKNAGRRASEVPRADFLEDERQRTHINLSASKDIDKDNGEKPSIEGRKLPDKKHK